MSNATELSLDPLSLIPPREELMALAEARRGEYAANTPYPHVIMDNFLRPEVADAILAAYPSPDSIDWIQFKTAREKKLAANNELLMPPIVRATLAGMNSATFVQFLERLTSINGIVPDAHYEGGGMHQIVSGGKLAVHVDFNKHPLWNLDRRMNLIIYLNKDWKDEYGGHFELWDAKAQGAEKRILPLFNRCVVFNTTDTSYHGHPNPLTCPPERTRKSLALYYYTNGRDDIDATKTHTTIFKDQVDPGLGARLKRNAKKVVRNITPPIVLKMFKGG